MNSVCLITCTFCSEFKAPHYYVLFIRIRLIEKTKLYLQELKEIEKNGWNIPLINKFYFLNEQHGRFPLCLQEDSFEFILTFEYNSKVNLTEKITIISMKLLSFEKKEENDESNQIVIKSKVI